MDPTLEILARIAKEARAFRDRICDDLRREGIIVEHRGEVTFKAEPYDGYGSIEWKNWAFTFPRRRG